MARVSDPGLSDFERRELSRDETGEPDAWYVSRTEDGGLQVNGEERLDRHPEWFVSLVFEVGKVDVRLLSMRVSPATLSPPPEGLTTGIVRSIRLGPLYTRARNTVTLPTGVGGARGLAELDDFGRVTRPGRRGRDDVFYARWAELYVEELAKGSNPLPGLAATEHLSESTIRSFLHEARRRELLTKSPPGRAGGSLTDKATNILLRHPQEL